MKKNDGLWEKLSGPELHLRYIETCIESKVNLGLISVPDAQYLRAAVENNTEPDILLLERCSPDAAKDLKGLAEATGRETWSRENVADYWHNKHSGKKSGCETRYLEVLSVDGERVHVVDHRFIVINFHRLPLSTGDRFYAHLGKVIEVVEKRR